MTEVIASRHNTKLKGLRKLGERKYRERSGLFMAEGEDMLAEALRHGLQPEVVFYDPSAADTLTALLDDLGDGVEAIGVEGSALAWAGSLGSGSRVIGVWRERWAPVGELTGDLPAVYLHEVSDPGNVGTVVRSALAFGAKAVLLSPETADPFAPKAVRSSMGAIFGQRVARATFEDAREALGSPRTIGLVPRRGVPLREANLEGPLLIALGAEREGLPDRIISACDEIAHVPLKPDGAESLNVAMAATLCLYESTQRRLPSAASEIPSA